MKHRVHLRGKHAPVGRLVAPVPIAVQLPGDAWPPPDLATRVELDLVAQAPPAREWARLRVGELIAAAGIGGILVALALALVKLLDLPSLSALTVAAFGVVLLIIGVVKRRSSRSALIKESLAVVEGWSAAVDLPSLTGQLGGVLAQLRQQHGLAYRTRTWIEDLLPLYGEALKDPLLARDLLAVAALDAGGIRADVAGLVDTYARDDIVATGRALLGALQSVLTSCEAPTDLFPAPPLSDPSVWAASNC